MLFLALGLGFRFRDMLRTYVMVRDRFRTNVKARTWVRFRVRIRVWIRFRVWLILVLWLGLGLA